ncbi:MAG: murein biosynthesis integral membrane protein MurJ [Candidatus Limnocylindrales bacterium]
MTATARTLAAAGLIVTAAFFVSRLLGWLRIVVISTIYGAGADLDSYFAAFRIPDAIFQLVAAGALSSALIPVLSGLVSSGDERSAWAVVSTVVNLMLIALLGLSVVMAIGAPVIIPIVTPGFDTVQTELTVRLSRIMLLSPILLAVGAVATSVLNTYGRFASAALAPLLYNGAIIVAAVLLSPVMGVEALAVGVVLGSLAHLAVQLPPVLRHRAFDYDFRLDLKDPLARQALLLMAPRAIGLSAAQITFVVNTTLASGLFTGAIVAYNVAFTILQIPIGIIGIPLGVVLLPTMSRAVASGAVREFGSLVVRSLRLLLYVMLFVTAVAMVLRRQVVSLLFDYGNFDAAAIDTTANTLLFFLIGLAAHSMIVVLARAFYAGKDTRTPVIAALVSVAVNVVVSVATVGLLGLSGLALGIAVGAWVETGILTVLLWQRNSGMALDSVGKGVAEFALGALLAAVAAFGVVRATEAMVGLEPAKITLVAQSTVAFGAAAITYVLYSRLLRIPELATSVEMVRLALRRGTPASP